MAPERVERRLAAILAAYMVGYSRLMKADQAETIARQKAHRTDLIDPKVAEHNGCVVITTPEGVNVATSARPAARGRRWRAEVP